MTPCITFRHGGPCSLGPADVVVTNTMWDCSRSVAIYDVEVRSPSASLVVDIQLTSESFADPARAVEMTLAQGTHEGIEVGATNDQIHIWTFEGSEVLDGRLYRELYENCPDPAIWAAPDAPAYDGFYRHNATGDRAVINTGTGFGGLAVIDTETQTEIAALPFDPVDRPNSIPVRMSADGTEVLLTRFEFDAGFNLIVIDEIWGDRHRRHHADRRRRLRTRLL